MATSLGKVNNRRVCNNPRNPYTPDACCGPTDLETGAEVHAHVPRQRQGYNAGQFGTKAGQQLAVRNV